MNVQLHYGALSAAQPGGNTSIRRHDHHFRCIVDHISSAGIRHILYSVKDPYDPTTEVLCEELGIRLDHHPITEDMRDAVREALEIHYDS